MWEFHLLPEAILPWDCFMKGTESSLCLCNPHWSISCTTTLKGIASLTQDNQTACFVFTACRNATMLATSTGTPSSPPGKIQRGRIKSNMHLWQCLLCLRPSLRDQPLLQMNAQWKSRDPTPVQLLAHHSGQEKTVAQRLAEQLLSWLWSAPTLFCSHALAYSVASPLLTRSLRYFPLLVHFRLLRCSL